MDNEKNQYKNYPEDLEEISSMLTLIKDILSRVKTNYINKEIFQLDPRQLKKDNETLKKGLSVLNKAMHATMQL
ncbi:MAG: hypothetical protein ACRDE2_00430 [Chitinophagaceae bacterium]